MLLAYFVKEVILIVFIIILHAAFVVMCKSLLGNGDFKLIFKIWSSNWSGSVYKYGSFADTSQTQDEYGDRFLQVHTYLCA